MSDKTATERLRQLLDERGVKYKYRDMFGKHVFHWGTPAVNGAMFTDGGKWTELVIENPTTEQAVEATLGRGTCKWEPADFITEGEWWKTSCGEAFTWEPDGTPNYCPNCGRKVEQ